MQPHGPHQEPLGMLSGPKEGSFWSSHSPLEANHILDEPGQFGVGQLQDSGSTKRARLSPNVPPPRNKALFKGLLTIDFP